MTDTDPASSTVPTRELKFGQHMAISAFWGAQNFVIGALIAILLALQVKDLAPQDSATRLGLLLGLGAIPAILIPLIAGPLSDRCLSRLGRRRPYILVGVTIAVLGLAVLYGAFAAQLFWVFFAGFFLLQVGINTSMAAYSGIIPDLVPRSQRGLASGYMAVMSQVGTLAGVFICGQLGDAKKYFECYLLLGLVLILGLFVTMVGVKETPLTEKPPPFRMIEYLKSLWIDPRKYPDFAWVWITRALVMTGFYGVQPFLVYYLGDVIKVEKPGATAAFLVAVVLVSATPSALIGGKLSDRLGRKRIVYWANGLMAIMCVAFAFCNTLTQVMVVGVLFGVGYGSYISVDWALGTDVLPNPDDAAKDMAVWHVSMTLPQSAIAIPAGFLLAAFGMSQGLDGDGDRVFHYTEFGYDALFIGAAICLALGAFLLRNVKGVR